MQQSYEHDQKFLQLLSPPRFACCCCSCYRLQIWRLPKSISLVQCWGHCSFGNLGSHTHRRTHAYWAHANQASAHRKVCNTFCALPIEWQQSKQAKAATSWRVANSAKVSPTPPPPLISLSPLPSLFSSSSHFVLPSSSLAIYLRWLCGSLGPKLQVAKSKCSSACACVCASASACVCAAKSGANNVCSSCSCCVPLTARSLLSVLPLMWQ